MYIDFANLELRIRQCEIMLTAIHLTSSAQVLASLRLTHQPRSCQGRALHEALGRTEKHEEAAELRERPLGNRE